MGNPIDDIQSLLNAMRDRGAEMDAFKGLLTSISQGMADIVSIMERPAAERAAVESRDDTALIAALQRLQLPTPVINVQPAAVSIPATSSPKGWKLQITGRDGAGNIAAISIKPE